MSIEDLGGGVYIAPDRGGWRWWAPLGCTGWHKTKGRAKGTGRQCANASMTIRQLMDRHGLSHWGKGGALSSRVRHARAWGMSWKASALLDGESRASVLRKMPVHALAAVGAGALRELAERPPLPDDAEHERLLFDAAMALICSLPPEWRPHLMVAIDKAEQESAP